MCSDGKLEIGLDRAGFAEFFFHTREQAGNWRGAGVREVQRAVDDDCSEGLLSFDATECKWCQRVMATSISTVRIATRIWITAVKFSLIFSIRQLMLPEPHALVGRRACSLTYMG